MRNMVKSVLLSGVLILLIGLNYAFSQNTGAGPYIDSWHTYRVIMGNAANNYEWDITQLGSSDTTKLVTKVGGELVTWVDNAISSSNNDISVFFGNTDFTAGQTWELLYREYSSGGTCIAARKFTITLTENNFFLTLAANDTLCKPQTGNQYSWDEVDNEVFNATLVYRVTLHKEAGHTLNSWSFDADIDLNPANHNYVSYTVAVVPVTEGTAVITDTPVTLDGQFSVEVSALTTANLTEVSVDVSVQLSGLLHDGIAATLNLLNGEAVSGNVGTIITNDNLGRPTAAAPDNVADAALRDRLQVIVLAPIPATRDIVHGAGETAVSAQNPLQNSTHRYAVQMGDVANFPRANTGWHIETTTGSLVPFIPANYELVRPDAADVTASGRDSATISFHMAPGNYMLYYTEESSNGCTTVRRFPISLGDPFDADILTVTDQCSGADGVIFQNLQDSTTTVDYTIRLNTSSYGSNWRFNFALTPTPAFANPDMEVHSVTPSPAGVTYNSGTGLVNVPSTVQEVTLRVVYNGQYINNHSIQATLTNITGSFNEVDADAANTITHTIFAMPQAGTLAGID